MMGKEVARLPRVNDEIRFRYGTTDGLTNAVEFKKIKVSALKHDAFKVSQKIHL